METIQSLLQKLSIAFSKTSQTSRNPPTPKMPSSPQSTTVENVEMLIEPVTTIAEIVASNTPKQPPSYPEDSPNETSSHHQTPEMTPSPQSTTLENSNVLIEPIGATTEVVTSNTPDHQPPCLEDSPNCIMDKAIKRESSPCVSPAKKKQKINNDNFPEIDVTEIAELLLDAISKFI